METAVANSKMALSSLAQRGNADVSRGGRGRERERERKRRKQREREDRERREIEMEFCVTGELREGEEREVKRGGGGGG